MYVHVKQNPTVIACLRLRGVRVVHLVRRNLLDILVSDDTRRARRQFHSSGVDLPPVKVAIDAGTVVQRLTALDRQVRVARRMLGVARVPTMEVAYEELVSAPARLVDLLTYIGLDDQRPDLTTDLRKRNKLPRREIIENYGEIERVLSRTRFAACLD